MLLRGAGEINEWQKFGCKWTCRKRCRRSKQVVSLLGGGRSDKRWFDQCTWGGGGGGGGGGGPAAASNFEVDHRPDFPTAFLPMRCSSCGFFNFRTTGEW